MAHASKIETQMGPKTLGNGYLFGAPMGDLGWFTSLLMGTATGFAAFFASTFLAIFGILIYNTVTHRAVDFAFSYRRVGLPVGLTVMAVALGYLGMLWAKRLFRRG
jgi:hypothetical protein